MGVIGFLLAGLLTAVSVGCLPTVAPEALQDGVFDGAYLVDDERVELVRGRAEIPAAPGSPATIATMVLGNPTYGDLNLDGRRDAALILRRDTGGSGTFYNVAAAIAADGGYR